MEFVKKQAKQRFILSAQYFVYFCVLGIYLPYFNLYCFHLKFSGMEIGLLSGIRTFAIVLFPIAWAIIADKFQIRRMVYILCNIVSCFLWVFLLFTKDFGSMLVVFIFYGIFYAPIISFLEAFSMDILGREKKKYGRLRMWGSISFILVVLILGRIIDIFSVKIIIPLILAGSIIQAVFSTSIPRIRKREAYSFIKGAKIFLTPRLMVFLGAAFLMLLSHGAYYGFFSIHLEKLGYDKTFIGFSWAVASIAEIFVMIWSDFLFRRFSIEKVLIFSFIAAVIRWFIVCFASSTFFILASQLLHAFTYGAFHVGSILYIDMLVPDEAKTFGQALNNAVTYGLGIAAGYIISGLLFDRMGASGLFGLAGMTAFAGGVVFWAYNRIVSTLKKMAS